MTNSSPRGHLQVMWPARGHERCVSSPLVSMLRISGPLRNRALVKALVAKGHGRPSRVPTQQFVDDVFADGGSLASRAESWYDREAVDYEGRVRLAERYRKVPAGERLLVTAIDHELEISVVGAPDVRSPAELVPLLVPKTVAGDHGAARWFRDRRERHEMSREVSSLRLGWVSCATVTEQVFGAIRWFRARLDQCGARDGGGRDCRGRDRACSCA